jgi:hypothetical protein
LQDFIFEREDEHGEKSDKQLTFGEFMEVVLQLRGTNQATVKDVVDLRKFFGSKIADLEKRILRCMGNEVSSKPSGQPSYSQGNGSTKAFFDAARTDAGGFTSCDAYDISKGKVADASEASCTWRIISDNPVNVRAEMDLLSGLLGQKQFGDHVRGFDVGGWVELADEPGFIVKRKQGVGEPLLERCGGNAPEISLAAAQSSSTQHLLDRLEDELQCLRQKLDAGLSSLERGLVRSLKRSTATATPSSAGTNTTTTTTITTAPSTSSSPLLLPGLGHGGGSSGGGAQASPPRRNHAASSGEPGFSQDYRYQPPARGRSASPDPRPMDQPPPPRELLAPYELDDEDGGWEDFIVLPSDNTVMSRYRARSADPRSRF